MLMKAMLFFMAFTPSLLSAQRITAVDTIPISDLLAIWVEEVSQPPVHTSEKTRLLVRILLDRTDVTRAEALLDGLEEVVRRSTADRVRELAVTTMTSGYQAGGQSGPLVRRFERMYRSTEDRVVRYAILYALPLVNGPGRQQAIGWLEQIITSSTDALAFPEEGEEAVLAAFKLGPAGRERVRQLLDQGQIVDRRARQKALMIGEGSEPL